MACQYDGASMLVYANGKKLAGEQIDKQLNCDQWPVSIGCDAYFPDRVFHGRISDVRYWDRVLTLDEIRANATHLLKGDEQGLVGYWDFTEGVGDTLHDRSAHAQHATISGAEWVTLDGKRTGKRPVGAHPSPTGRQVTVTVPGNATWHDSGVDLTKGRRYSFAASGTWGHEAGASYNAGGSEEAAPAAFVIPGAAKFALLGRIEGLGRPFVIGERLDLVAEDSGRLYMQMNDDRPGNNVGSLRVTIVSEGKASSRSGADAGKWQSLFDGKSLAG